MSDTLAVGSADTVVRLARLRRMVRSGHAKAIRIDANLSLAELAAAIGPDGVSHVTVYRWENQERSPHGELALAYLAVLDALVLAGA